MDNENAIKTEEENGDKKAAKKAAKLAKREEKAKKREEKQRQKLAKAGASPEEIERALANGAEYEEEGGSRLAVFFVTLVIVVIWLAILALLVKMDVGGFGSNVLAPILKDVPVVNRILPSAAPAMENTDSEGYGGYASLEEAVDYIKQLELELEREQTASNAKNTEVEALKAEVLRLQEFEQRQVEFQRIKTEFYEEVANLDPEGLLKYYESMDPTTMEYIAKQIAVQEQRKEDLDNYIQTFAKMKPKSAAKMFEAMSDRLELVAEILEAMTVEQRADIMNVIDTELGAKLVKMMHPDS